MWETECGGLSYATANPMEMLHALNIRTPFVSNAAEYCVLDALDWNGSTRTLSNG